MEEMRAKTLKGVQEQNCRRPLPIPPLLHLPSPGSPKPMKEPNCYFLLSPKLVPAFLSPTCMIFSPLAHYFPFSSPMQTPITHLHNFFPSCPSLPFSSPMKTPIIAHYSPITAHVLSLLAATLQKATNTPPFDYKSHQ